MKRVAFSPLVAASFLALIGSDAGAQIARTRAPGSVDVPAGASIPRNPQFPYAGAWSGTRRMPVGDDPIRFNFTVVDDKYQGVTLHPGGASSPQRNLVASATGLTWEQPNSGGGTWVFRMRLASADSMVGTIVLRDAPANFDPVPAGTMTLTRVAPPKPSTGRE